MKKTALAIFFVLSVLALTSGAPQAHAFGPTAQAGTPTQVPNFLSCALTGSFATCLVYLVTYAISNIIGLFISLAGLLIQLGLQFDLNVYNSPIVQGGFGVCLSIANLGFVLAIIIIALATVFRSETYGYKKALWRLVVMAILVNFGLVITAPIVNFADGISTYFISQASAGAGFSNFVTNLTSHFNPGVAKMPPYPNATAMCSATASASLITSAIPTSLINAACTAIMSVSNAQQQSVGQNFVQALLSMNFSIVLQLVILLSFLLLAALLLIRYVALALLLVVLPFAWLAWIFPNTKSHFSTWWSHFIKWTFFPPAALFFVWLALSLNQSAYLNSVATALGNQNDPNSPIAGIMADIGGFAPIEAMAQDVVIMGILIGGLMMASKLTGEAGAFAVAQAKGVSNAVTGYVGKRSKQAGSAVLRSQRARNAAVNAQQPGKPFPMRWLGRLATAGAVAGGEDVIAAAKKDIHDSPEVNKQKISTTGIAAARIARISKALDDKLISPDKMTEEERQAYFGKNKEDMYKRYGSEGEKIYREGREKSGLERDELIAEKAAFERQALEAADHGDTTAFDELSKKANEKTEKLDALHKRQAADDPEALASNFQAVDQREKALEKAKASGKPLPASVTVSKESIRQVQNAILEGMTESFSPTNASALINALSKKNNLKEFGEAVDWVKREDPARFQKLKVSLLKNETLVRWFEKNSGKALIDYKKMFGIDPSELPVSARSAPKDKTRTRSTSAPTSTPPEQPKPKLYDAYGREIK